MSTLFLDLETELEQYHQSAYNDPHLLAQTVSRYYWGLTKEVDDAFRRRHLKHSLYSAFHSILDRHSETVIFKEPPFMTLSCEIMWPVSFPEGHLVSRPKFTVNNVEFEMRPKNPTFRRFLEEFQRPVGERALVDFFTIKPLDTRVNWTSPEAEAIARDAIPTYLPELYSQAMVNLFLHPHCTEIYATLVVGVFFTQLCWTRAENYEIRPAVHLDFDPHIPFKEEKLNDMIERTQAAIEECRTRMMPSVLCWNEPVFNFHPQRNVAADGLDASVTLTDEFLWSLHAPLRRHESVKLMPSWFSPPMMPVNISEHIDMHSAESVIRIALLQRPLEELLEKYEWLLSFGFESPESSISESDSERSLDLDLAMDDETESRSSTSEDSS